MKGINSITVKKEFIEELIKCMEKHDFKAKDIDRVVLIKDCGMLDGIPMTNINVISKDHSSVYISFPTEKEDEN